MVSLLRLVELLPITITSVVPNPVPGAKLLKLKGEIWCLSKNETILKSV